MIEQILLNRMRQLRRERNLTQENMAEQLKMSPSNYAKMEEGKVKIYIRRLEEIAKILEVTIFYLLEHECAR